MRFADIHTHILYGIDDGADTLETSLALLDTAYRDGVRAVFLTPHCFAHRLDFARANEAMLQFKPHIQQSFKDLLVFGGCEMMYSSLTLNGLIDGRVPTLAGSQYVLVEFSPAIFMSDMLDAVRMITTGGFSPIIAHAERYRYLTPKGVPLLIDTGAYIQLNAASVTGKAGGAAKRFCHKLLKEEMAHFIASDCHDLKRRKPGLADCAALVASKYGAKYAEQLFYKNALKIIDNSVI